MQQALRWCMCSWALGTPPLRAHDCLCKRGKRRMAGSRRGSARRRGPASCSTQSPGSGVLRVLTAKPQACLVTRGRRRKASAAPAWQQGADEGEQVRRLPGDKVQMRESRCGAKCIRVSGRNGVVGHRGLQGSGQQQRLRRQQHAVLAAREGCGLDGSPTYQGLTPHNLRDDCSGSPCKCTSPNEG
jgi:hypothetical protein